MSETTGAAGGAEHEASRAARERDALLNLIVRPLREEWEAKIGPRKYGLFPTREAAIEATRAAALALLACEKRGNP